MLLSLLFSLSAVAVEVAVPSSGVASVREALLEFSNPDILLMPGYNGVVEGVVEVNESVTIRLQDPGRSATLPPLHIIAGAGQTVTLDGSRGAGKLMLGCQNVNAPLLVWEGHTTARLTASGVRSSTSTQCVAGNMMDEVAVFGGGQVTLADWVVSMTGLGLRSTAVGLTISDSQFSAAPRLNTSFGLSHTGAGSALVLRDTQFSTFALPAVFVEGADEVQVTGGLFAENAVVSLSEVAETLISGTVFRDNTRASALSWYPPVDGTLRIERSHFFRNQGDEGAALTLGGEGNTRGTVEMLGSSFCDNDATLDQCADAAVNAKGLTVSGSTFARSGGAGGVCATLWDDSEVRNNTFAEIAETGVSLRSADIHRVVEVYAENNGAVSVGEPFYSVNVNWTGGYNAAWDSGPSSSSMLNTIIWNLSLSEPSFSAYDESAACESLDFSLGAVSSWRDAGHPSTLDPDGTRSDLGAYGGPDAPIDDEDGDGWFSDRDCDDHAAATHPGATEQWYDGVDRDCDGAHDYDRDGDGFVHADWAPQAGGSAPYIGDCDDQNPVAHPGAPEIWYDGVDENCDGSSDFDRDGDGHDCDPAVFVACALSHGDDCDDQNALVNPAATETYYDGPDGNCDGANDYDADGDGCVSADYPEEVGGSAPCSGDCDDTSALFSPTAEERWYDGADQNCDDANDYDQDGDGVVCLGCEAYAGTLATGDCDDEPSDDEGGFPSAAEVGPQQSETWYDGVDQDCDGWSDYDQDRDGYDCDSANNSDCPDATGDDCDDSPSGAGALPGFQVNPGAAETWYDGVDQDCDGGSDDDADGDGFPTGEDCDDTAASVFPGASDDKGDGVDADCDGSDGAAAKGCAHTGGSVHFLFGLVGLGFARRRAGRRARA